jgi:hypothetical protein
MTSFERVLPLRIIMLASIFVLAMGSAAWADATPDAANGGNPICDQRTYEGVSAQLERYNNLKDDYVRANYTPPPPLAEIDNTACSSRELQRISNKFAYMPTRYTSGIFSMFKGLLGPVAGIVNKLFRTEIDSINSALAAIPRALNFQSQANAILSDLLSSLGLSDEFSSALCGLMVDMLLKYIQCEVQPSLPNLGNLNFSLNLPGCAGAAVRSTLYAAGNMRSLSTFSQPVSVGAGGVFVPGSAWELNKDRGTEW